MATYTEMITRVRNYLDRDSTVITDAQVVDFLNYAADKAYRTLRIPAHEAVVEFTVATSDVVADASSSSGTEIRMAVPNDLIELIYIQKKGTGIVWNQKVDARTFHDRYADKKDSNYYTRIGGNFILHGTLSAGDILEVCYYQRGNAINSTYDITPANYLAQTTKGITTMTRVTGLTVPVTYASSALVLDGDSKPTMILRKGSTYIFDVSSGTMGSKTLVFKDSGGSTYTTGITLTGTPGNANAKYTFIVAADAPDTLSYQEGSTASAGNSVTLASPDSNLVTTLGFKALYFADAATAAQVDALTPTTIKAASETSYTQAIWFEKVYQTNWLRDQNERIILYGALAEAFTYLEEPNQSQVYEARFLKEISELNTEETTRSTSGGNTSVSFSGMGLI